MKKISLLLIIVVITSISLYGQNIPVYFQHKKHDQEILQETQVNNSETKQAGYSYLKKSYLPGDEFGNPPKWMWSAEFGGSGNDTGTDIALDSDGNVYQLCYFNGTTAIDGISFNSIGSKDALVIKYDNDGNIIWSKQFSSTEHHTVIPRKIYISDNGYLVFTGYYTGTVSFDDFVLPETNSNELFFVKMNPDGDVLSAHHYSSAYLSNLKPQTDEFGNIYILTEKKSNDYFSPVTILKFDADGALITKYQNNSNISDFVIKNNTIYFTGTINKNGTIGDSVFQTNYFDLFVATSDLDFNFNWAYMAEHDGSCYYEASYGSQLFIDGDNNIYISGVFDNNIVFFGSSLFTSASFIVKIKDNTTLWLRRIDDQNTSRPGEYYLDLCNNSVYITASLSKDISALNKDTGFFIGSHKIDRTYVAITGANDALFISGNENGLIYLSKLNGSFEPQFNKEFTGDSGYGFMMGTEADSVGNVYVYGYTSAETSYFGETLNKGAFLARHNQNGDLEWLLQFSGIYFDNNSGLSIVDKPGVYVAVDPDNQFIYVTGFFNEAFDLPGGGPVIQPNYEKNIIICKYDLNGNFKYVIQEQTSKDNYNICLSPDQDGNIVISSLFRDVIVIGNTSVEALGLDDFYIAKYDASGSFQWVKHSGSDSFEYDALVTTDSAGNIYFTGEALGEEYVKFNGEEVTLKDGDGNIVLAKLSADGDLIWFKTVGGSPTIDGDYYCWPTGILTKKDNEIYLKGWHADSCWFDDIMLVSPYAKHSKFVAKINGDGNFQWANSIHEQKYGFDCASMGVDDAGNVYTALEVRDTVWYGDVFRYDPVSPHDLVISRYSENGILNWVKGIPGGSYRNWLGSLTAVDTANLFAGGVYSDYISLGDDEYYADKRHGFFGLLAKSTVGIYEAYNHNAKVRIYPNPFSDETTIEFKNLGHQPYSLKVVDVSGKTVFEKHNITSGKIVFMRNELPKGVYFFHLTGNQQFSGKLMIE